MRLDFSTHFTLKAWSILFFLFVFFYSNLAFSSNFKLTETFTATWHSDNRDKETTNDDYFDFKNRLDILHISPMLDAILRVDTMTIFDYDLNDPEAPPNKVYRDDYRIERISGVLKPSKNFKITLGDFYTSLGSGILLSLQKIDEFGSETVLRGGKVDFDSRHISWSLMGGVTNVNNIDEMNNYFFEDPMDRISAGRISGKPFQSLKIEAMGLFMERDDPRLKSPHLYGTGIMIDSSPLPGKLAISGEYDVIWREKGVADISQFQRGQGAYLKFDATVGRFSFLLEGKWYEKLDISGSILGDTPIQYNLPPTAEKVDQEILDNSTVYGGRIKGSFRISDNFSVYANFSAGDYAPLTDVLEGNEVSRIAYYLHAYGGFTIFLGEGLSEISAEGGWRKEMEPELGDTDDKWNEHSHNYHVETKMVFYLGRGFSLRYSLLHEARGNAVGLGFVKYERGTQILGLDLSGVMSLNAGFEYDTQSHKMPFSDNLYGWGEGKFFPTKWMILSLKGGIERGGLKCVSGVCRTIPPFSGVKMSVVIRY